MHGKFFRFNYLRFSDRTRQTFNCRDLISGCVLDVYSILPRIQVYKFRFLRVRTRTSARVRVRFDRPSSSARARRQTVIRYRKIIHSGGNF